MTRTDKLKKIREAEAERRAMRKAVAVERQVSQSAGFILTLGEGFDPLIPFGISPAFCRWVVVRRIRRQQAEVARVKAAQAAAAR